MKIGALMTDYRSAYTGIYHGIDAAQSNTGISTGKPNPEESKSGIETPLNKAVGKTECQTCKNRKYVDGSDEMVSFKAPGRISANEAPGKVRAHEQEHVANAFSKAARGGGKVLQASVSLKTAICPECGRSYIAGGTTTTRISYPKDDPYSRNQKSNQKEALLGANVDFTI